MDARKPRQRPRCADRVYRRLLWLYPARFRRVYGPAMVQSFRDGWRELERRASRGSRLRFWFFILADTGKGAGRENVKALSATASALMKIPKLEDTNLREEQQRRHLGGLIVGGSVLAVAAGFLLAWSKDAWKRDPDGPTRVTFCFTQLDEVGSAGHAVIRMQFPYGAAQQKPAALDEKGNSLWNTNLYRAFVILEDWMVGQVHPSVVPRP